MGHRKRFYSLPPGSISRACTIASVREKYPADRGSVHSVAVSVRIGIDDSQHVCMLVGDIGVVASASLSAPIHPVRSRGSRNEFDHLLGCSVAHTYGTRRI